MRKYRLFPAPCRHPSWRCGWIAAVVAAGLFLGSQPRLDSQEKHSQEKGTATSPENDDENSSATIRNILFFGESRPIFLRLHLQLDSQPLEQTWQQHVDSTFAFLDSDGDGVLTLPEYDRMDWGAMSQNGSREGPQFFKLLLSGLTGSKSSDTTPETVSALAFRNKFRQRFEPFSIQSRTPETATGEEIFSRLDRNQDQTISQEEWTGRHEVLRRLDSNDDELISRSELAQFLNPFFQPQFQGSNNSPNASTDFLSLDEPHQHETIAYRLLTTYGEPSAPGLSSDRVTAANLGLTAEEIAGADADQDQTLQREELPELLRDPPRQLELRFHMSSEAMQPQPESQEEQEAAAPSPVWGSAASRGGVELLYLSEHLGRRVRVTAEQPQQLVLLVDQHQFEFLVAPSTSRNYSQYFTNQFKACDTDNNGYLDEEEFTARQQIFGAGFSIIDTDQDEKIFEDELLEHFKRQISHYQNRLEWNVISRGRRLFQLLDKNADGLLTQRELAIPYERLLQWDGNGGQIADGSVQADEIPRCFTLTLSTGQPNRVGGVSFGNDPVSTYRNIARTDDSRPSWFRKLDRNQDGDLSPREFPGPVVLFEKFDRDANRLLDPSEVTP